MSRPALALSQKMALLWIRRCGPESLAFKVTECMRAMGLRFGAADLAALAGEGLIRRAGSRHELLPRGLAHAQVIQRDLARAYGIHHFTRRTAAGNMGPSIACVCGWSTHASHNRSADSVLSAGAEHHLAMVAAGRWPPRPVEAVLAETLAFLPTPAGASPTSLRAPAPRGAVPSSSGAAPHLLPEAGHG